MAYFPLAVFSVVLRRYAGLSSETAAATIDWSVFVLLPVQMVWFYVMTAIVATMASRAYLQEPLDPGTTWKVAFPRLPAIIVSGFLVTIGSAIAFIFLVFPAIYFYTRFGMSPLIAALEGTSTNESLTRATHLSRGQKLHILGAGLLALLLYFIVSIGLGILFTMVPSMLLKTIFSYFGTILVWPMLPMVQTVLYYDLRIRAEGYDVDLMSRTLGPLAGGSAEAAF